MVAITSFKNRATPANCPQKIFITFHSGLSENIWGNLSPTMVPMGVWLLDETTMWRDVSQKSVTWSEAVITDLHSN